MEWYKGPEGDTRIWYEESDIELAVSGELRRARQRLTLADPTPDLEAFVENHLKVDLDQYADLPDDVLGLTEFSDGGSPRMKINSTLTEAADENPSAAGKRGRWRATIAHEAAHVILHRYLFDSAIVPIGQGDFRDPIAGHGATVKKVGQLNRMTCLHRDIDAANATPNRRSRDWREIQANRGMAALLMPESIFSRVALVNGGVKGEPKDPESAEGVQFIGRMAAVFDVSKQAAKYRLRGFQYLA
jgi:IrrE N-terminal-like domain